MSMPAPRAHPRTDRYAEEASRRAREQRLVAKDPWGWIAERSLEVVGL